MAVEASAREHSICYVEDGFLRSGQPHSGRSAPFSLVLDRRRPYFDAGGASDLENLLNSYDFEADRPLRQRALAVLQLFLNSGLSKYNVEPAGTIGCVYRPKQSRRILVIGQVEEDASILLGCDRKFGNLDLVLAAKVENPDAEIFYRPHPDVLNKVRLGSGGERNISALCQVIRERIPLAQALDTVDHVYTITSLAGFEAMLRGIKVTTFGCPFYAGWGLTDDRQPNPRRKRRLETVDIFAAAYLLYARYFDPRSGRAISFEEALSLLQERSGTSSATDSSRITGPLRHRDWRAFGPYGVLGWRHLLTSPVAAAIARIGNSTDARHYREDPIGFFRELPDRRFRFVGRMLYPFGH